MSEAMKYAVVIDRGPESYGAHLPDLAGCVAVTETKAKVCNTDSGGYRTPRGGSGRGRAAASSTAAMGTD